MTFDPKTQERIPAPAISSRRHSRLFLTIVTCIVSYQVFLPPMVGSANNADFGKIAGLFGLGAPHEGNNIERFAYQVYVFDPQFHWHPGFRSSETLLLMASLAVNRVVSKTGTFDIRVMGLVQAAVLVAAFWLLPPLLASMTRVSRYLVLTLTGFIFTDVMYVSYMNSFFMDTAGLLFGLLAIVLFMRSLRWRRASDRWCFVAALVLMITSKAQHYPLGIPAALYLGWRGHLLTPSRGYGFVAAAVTIVLAATVFSAYSVPPEYPTFGCYTVVFFQILPHSKNVERDLADLGLNGADARYVGTHAYSSDSALRDPEFTKRFTRHITYGKIAWFFATHPVDLLAAAEARLAEAGRQRPPRGNFDPSAGQPEYAESKSFAVWSDIKAAIFNQHGARYLTYALLLALLATTLAAFERTHLPPGIPEAVGTLAMMFLLELAVGSLADALDAARHFLLFSALSDVLLIIVVCLVVTGARVLLIRDDGFGYGTPKQKRR